MSDPICNLSPTGYCERHQTTHVGRQLELALSDDDLGGRYRLLWDRALKGETVEASAEPSPRAGRPARPTPQELAERRDAMATRHLRRVRGFRPCCGQGRKTP